MQRSLLIASPDITSKGQVFQPLGSIITNWSRKVFPVQYFFAQPNRTISVDYIWTPFIEQVYLNLKSLNCLTRCDTGEQKKSRLLQWKARRAPIVGWSWVAIMKKESKKGAIILPQSKFPFVLVLKKIPFSKELRRSSILSKDVRLSPSQPWFTLHW